MVLQKRTTVMTSEVLEYSAHLQRATCGEQYCNAGLRHPCLYGLSSCDESLRITGASHAYHE
jgi:hypothetical protein